MATLQTKIAELAEAFAANVVAAVRSVPLDELMDTSGAARRAAKATQEEDVAPTPARRARKTSSGRLARRSPEEIDAMVGQIVGVLKDAPDGLRSEEIQKVLGIDKREISGPIAQALGAKKIRKVGEKRATTYFAGGKSAPKTATKAAPKKKAKAKTKSAKTAPKKAPKAKAKSATKKVVAKAAAPKKTPKKSASKPKVKKAVVAPKTSNGALNSGAAAAPAG